MGTIVYFTHKNIFGWDTEKMKSQPKDINLKLHSPKHLQKPSPHDIIMLRST